MAGLDVSPALHFLTLALPLALLLKLGHAYVAADNSKNIEKQSFVLPRGPLALLGTLGFLGSVVEGSIANWSGIFLRDHFGVSAGVAPLSLTAFSAMMLLSRLFGDRLKMTHGARKLIFAGALVAAAGLFSAVFATEAQCALAGFALAGLGLSLIFPFVFSAAGRDGPIALAGVATMTYAGTLIGPPLLGSVAYVLGMQAAMGAVAGLGLMIALVAQRTRLLDRR
jgi:MFS family permease